MDYDGTLGSARHPWMPYPTWRNGCYTSRLGQEPGENDKKTSPWLIAAGVGAVALGGYALLHMPKSRGRRRNPTPALPEIGHKPVKATTRLAIGIGAGAAVAAVAVAAVAVASNKAVSGPAVATPSELALTTADSGKTFAVKPGTVIAFSLPTTGWSATIDDGAANTAVQWGAASGPYPAEGGEGFLAQAVQPGASRVTFRHPNIPGTFQFMFVVAPTR